MKKTYIFIKSITVGIVLVLINQSCAKQKAPYAVINNVDCPKEISYSKDIMPLMDANCVICHSKDNPLGGYDLSSYDGIKGNPSFILSSMKHTGSAQPMPQGADKLADSLIQKMSCWISQGVKNN